MKIRILLLFLLMTLTFSHTSLASAWQRKIINYERASYKAGFQNWKIDQSDRGIIYVANSTGLLEFDGTNWQLYNANNKVMRAVKSVDRRIYVGGSSEFGYFEPSSMGILTYHSLTKQIANLRCEIWNIFSVDEKVYFIGEKEVFIYENNIQPILKLNIDSKINSSALVNNKLYIASAKGIYELQANHLLKLLPYSKILANTKVVSMLPAKDKLYIVTSKAGIYEADAVSCKKIDWITDSFIQSNQLFSASLTANQLILGTVQNGVFIVDLQNKNEVEQFYLDNGLKNNTILNSFVDKSHNLWLALDKGIAYIDLTAPTRPLFAKDSPIGAGYCSIVYNNHVFFGTNQGLYRKKSDESIEFIQGSEGQVWSLSIHDNLLFCAGDNHIVVISPTEMYKINVSGAWSVNRISKKQDKLLVGLYSGLAVLEKKNNRWVLSHTVANTHYYSARELAEDDTGTGFWVANEGDVIHKLHFNDQLTDTLSTKQYKIENTSIGGNVFFRKIDNATIICTLNGIYQYSRISDTFIHYPELESVLDGRKYYEYLFIDEKKNIWFISNNHLLFTRYLPNKGYDKRPINVGLENELMGKYQHISLLDSSTAIVAVDNAFVKVNIDALRHQSAFNTLITRISTTGGEHTKLFGGIEQIPIILDYKDNSIAIHFSTTNFSESEHLLYSYRLNGIDDKWSIPSNQTYKEYTNLYEGDYVFEVKAFMNGNGDSAKVTKIAFTVLPPWYRTIWAYIAYFLLFCIASVILYRKTVSKQKKIVRQKKEELRLQSYLHEEERKQKDNEIYILQNENLKTELHYKSQVLTGYILNVIKKNEALGDIKKNLVAISESIDKKQEAKLLKQKVVRLISDITAGFEQDVDFQVFESNFNIIHRDFLKILSQRYSSLSQNDKILCTYLKMNLSSKEIAPLLGISARSVEVSRYRLRKKMNLEHEVSLSEFLQNIQ